MLILRIQDRVYGTIVDKIDKVVGINTENIQPPHPIFGDINIKYISGVVEKDSSLYIILDVLRIFSHNKEEEKKQRTAAQERTSENFYAVAPVSAEQVTITENASGNNLDFIKEALPTLKRFYPSRINDDWIQNRFAEWSQNRSGADIQLKNESDADRFLSSFYSPDTGNFWNEEYGAIVKGLLPQITSNTINVWNIGCGKGCETYSFMCILKTRYPAAHIKIWANDSDIMAISQAPNMQYELEEVPEYLRSFMVKGRSGYSFNQEIKDSIVFEYHDVSNDNPLPDLDIILARDVLSFLSEGDQYKLAGSFGEKLKGRGIVILGINEIMPGDEWHFIGQNTVSLFEHNG